MLGVSPKQDAIVGLATVGGGISPDQALQQFFAQQGVRSVAAQLPQHDPAFRATFASFRELTDPALLAVQPARIELVTLDQAMTLAQFQSRSPSTIPLEELALINGVKPADTLPAGRLVKRVTGGPPASP